MPLDFTVLRCLTQDYFTVLIKRIALVSLPVCLVKPISQQAAQHSLTLSFETNLLAGLLGLGLMHLEV